MPSTWTLRCIAQNEQPFVNGLRIITTKAYPLVLEFQSGTKFLFTRHAVLRLGSRGLTLWDFISKCRGLPINKYRKAGVVMVPFASGPDYMEPGVFVVKTLWLNQMNTELFKLSEIRKHEYEQFIVRREIRSQGQVADRSLPTER